MVLACVAPAGYVAAGDDCDDSNPAIHPGATEVCDGRDDDCNGGVDEGCSCTAGDSRSCGSSIGACVPGTQSCTTGAWGDCTGATLPTPEVCDGKDDDCNGSVDEGCACTAPATQVCGTDVGVCQTGTQSCDAGFWSVCQGDVPPTPEVCDGKDDDCNGVVDDRLDTTWYADTDGDGHGDPATSVQACGAPTGYVSLGDDCNDGNASVHPGATEVCNGIDDNCDGVVDPGCNCVDGTTRSCGSGVGACQPGTQACAGGQWSACNGGTGPTAEVCNGVDDNCDGTVDEGCGCTDGATKACGSSVGVCQPGTQTCTGGLWGACQGYTGPTAETCDGKDDDCNGTVDDGATQRWYRDADADGHGDPTQWIWGGCTAPAGYVADATDCNDADPTVHPGATEVVADGIDQDCNGVDACYQDQDGDGYGSTVVVDDTNLDCSDGSAPTSAVDTDCNDADPAEHPGVTWYPDADGDGYGDMTATGAACARVSPTDVTDHTDCDDTDPTVHPGAAEGPYGAPTCSDGKDNDCDSFIDTQDLDCAGPSACGWWDSAYQHRVRFTVANRSTRTLTAGYTVTLPVDHAALVAAGKALASGDDVRVVYCDAGTNVELDRVDDGPHQVPAAAATWNTSTALVAFASQKDVGGIAGDPEYFLYYDDAAATAPPADPTRVYLWYDDFSADTRASYTQQKYVDIHGAVNQYLAPGYDAAGQRLTFDTGDNVQSDVYPKAPPVADALVEVQFDADLNYQTNATVALVQRAQLVSNGTHYYLDFSHGSYVSPGITVDSWQNGERSNTVYSPATDYYWPFGTQVCRYAVWGDQQAFWWNSPLTDSAGVERHRQHPPGPRPVRLRPGPGARGPRPHPGTRLRDPGAGPGRGARAVGRKTGPARRRASPPGRQVPPSRPRRTQVGFYAPRIGGDTGELSPGRAGDPRRWTVRGPASPLRRFGPRSTVAWSARPAARRVSSVSQTSPPAAASQSREAMFTAGPMTV